MAMSFQMKVHSSQMGSKVVSLLSESWKNWASKFACCPDKGLHTGDRNRRQAPSLFFSRFFRSNLWTIRGGNEAVPPLLEIGAISTTCG